MKRRWFKVLALVFCFALLAVGVRVFFGRERLLLQHAVKLRLQDVKDKLVESANKDDMDADSDGYTWQRQWMPNGEVVEIHGNVHHNPTLYGIAHHNLHTGATTIKTVPFGNQLDERYADPALSPDGQWLMWYTIQNEAIVYAWNAVTGQRLRWRVEHGDYRHFENHWLADNHHWLEYVTVPQHVTLHDTQGVGYRRCRIFPLPHSRSDYPPHRTGM